MKIGGLTHHIESGIIGDIRSLLSSSKLVNHSFFPETLAADFQIQAQVQVQVQVHVPLVLLIQEAQLEVDALFAQAELDARQHNQYLQLLLEQLALVRQMILAPDDVLQQLREQQYQLVQQQIDLLRQNLPQ